MSDDRVFAWRRAALPKVDGSVRDPSPVILYDRHIGGPNKIVGEAHKLAPTEYGDDLETLAARYPPPAIADGP